MVMVMMQIANAVFFCSYAYLIDDEHNMHIH